MPRIPSPNEQVFGTTVPSTETNYVHPADRRSPGGIAMAFQVTSPFDKKRVLLPHALVLHVNPQNLQESDRQKVERIQTRGGWVEQHWKHDLVELTADGSTGTFMNIYTGTASVLRQRTIAWDRYRDLHDLYLNNGSLHDPFGNIVLQGQIMLMYDRGSYLGTFRNFEVEETDESPFAFKLNWMFKIELMLTQWTGVGSIGRAPGFQRQNRVSSDPRANEATKLAAEQTALGQAALEERRAAQAEVQATLQKVDPG